MGGKLQSTNYFELPKGPPSWKNVTMIPFSVSPSTQFVCPLTRSIMGLSLWRLNNICNKRISLSRFNNWQLVTTWNQTYPNLISIWFSLQNQAWQHPCKNVCIHQDRWRWALHDQEITFKELGINMDSTLLAWERRCYRWSVTNEDVCRLQLLHACKFLDYYRSLHMGLCHMVAHWYIYTHTHTHLDLYLGHPRSDICYWTTLGCHLGCTSGSHWVVVGSTILLDVLN